MTKTLFDSSAIIAMIKREAGYKNVEHLSHNVAMSLVNVSEVVSSLSNLGFAEQRIRDIVSSMIPNKVEFTEEIAMEAGLLRPRTKHLGLSFGDRACIATAIIIGANIYTADRAWLDLKGLDIKIESVR